MEAITRTQVLDEDLSRGCDVLQVADQGSPVPDPLSRGWVEKADPVEILHACLARDGLLGIFNLGIDWELDGSGKLPEWLFGSCYQRVLVRHMVGMLREGLTSIRELE